MTESDATIPTLPDIAEDFQSCGRCGLTVRRSELQIHLAHAHNIGPAPDKPKKKQRGRDR